ncbi:hypothetical protein KC853_00850 [Candidatus Saccharibacteria bacterium]|nr:hypothetical protein [Candidatus Saccharibacteria bacterium]MCB9835076.1 hypothetical protein [Candidatus Nomurabacteria bacterium]
MINPHESNEPNLESLRPNLTPEEACLSALLDLEEYQTRRPGKAVAVGDFYTAFSGSEAPSDVRTRISTSPVEHNPQGPPHLTPQSSYVAGCEVAAIVIVDFEARSINVRNMLNFDFVKTDEGLQLIQRQLLETGYGDLPHYIRRLTEDEIAALIRDAKATKELIVEEDAELMKLGPLVEEEGDVGTRRFHIGDVLAVTTGRFTSPRGMEGIYDILGYMTDELPYSNQLERFAEECKPYLERRLGKVIGPFSEVPETITDRLSRYRWLNAVTEEMNGDPFLMVGKIAEEDHAVIDPMTELRLDYGPKKNE